ncbi:galactokinase [Grosmannia clavigera kw1407]|uniref:Galactokinase n=1 Tax=Grosmannia clavigera (strain kw1407 / UAMH 11150) TaxID=655863 RepID=F0XL51_GROCL|nr:galactokinase [Grosmannia clavigera kw1407]EFX01798.1 galactokinase [Grosmannia clavigera kw1407]
MSNATSAPQAYWSSYAPRLRTYNNSLLVPVNPSAPAVPKTTKRGTTIINYAEDGFDDYDDDDDDLRRRPSSLRTLRRDDSVNKIETSDKVGKDTSLPVEVQGIWRDWQGKSRLPRSDSANYVQACLPSTLIPIRIDVDIPAFIPVAPLGPPIGPQPGTSTINSQFDMSNPLNRQPEMTSPYRLRDTFLWNLHETLITTDQFALGLTQDLDLPIRSSVAAEISKQIRTQLEEYAGVALHPLFHTQTGSALVTRSPDLATLATNVASDSLRNGTAAQPSAATLSPNTVKAAATAIHPGSDDYNPDDTYRCIVNLNINLSSRLYTDKFEWSLLHPPGTAEAFAKQTCADLGLSGEWVPAMTHAIYEAVLRLKKEACEAGGLVAGFGPGGLTDFPNDAVISAAGEGAGWRYDPEHLGGQWEPKLEMLTKEEIERREGDRERQLRRLRRETARFSSNTGMAGGVPLGFGFGGLALRGGEARQIPVEGVMEEAVLLQTANALHGAARIAVYGEPVSGLSETGPWDHGPGRVNIIGEHIDYSLYSVLPMAITADCLLAIRSVDSAGGANSATFKVQIANVQSSKFPAHEFDVSRGTVGIDSTVHEWANYFKSGLRGALDLLRERHGNDFTSKSMQVLMDGTVPVGGGLSSSAAFTSASALGVMFANGETQIDKTELTELAIVSERSVGVNSGGMDQSASVFSEQGSALFVSFTPQLTALPVFFPPTNPELSFLIAQSFVAADKYVTGPVNYNLRVVECTLAAAYMNAVLNPPGTVLPSDSGPLGISLHGFHDTYIRLKRLGSSRVADSADYELQQMLDLVEKVLPKEGYTREEIASVLGISIADLDVRYMSRFPVRATIFKLQQRARHVFGEARRVLNFMELLSTEAHDSNNSDTSAYNEKLGALLNETQNSCRDLYECSCPELDQLCAIARKAGSYGSRLTGAGWGGCSVHLVPTNKIVAIKEAWESEYYSKRDLTPEQREAAVVVSKPGSGSALLNISTRLWG